MPKAEPVFVFSGTLGGFSYSWLEPAYIEMAVEGTEAMDLRRLAARYERMVGKRVEVTLRALPSPPPGDWVKQLLNRAVVEVNAFDLACILGLAEAMLAASELSAQTGQPMGPLSQASRDDVRAALARIEAALPGSISG